MGGFSALLLLGASEGPGIAPEGYGWALAKMLLALTAVCLLAYLVLRGARRWMSARAQGERVRILERCPLSSRHSLWLVEVGGRFLLLGSSDTPGGAVTRLAELDPREVVPAQTPTPPRASFRELLRRAGAGPSSGGEP